MPPGLVPGQHRLKDGLQFAFGDFSSTKPLRTVTVSFPEVRDPGDVVVGAPNTSFAFVSSMHPIVVTCYADDCYLLDFAATGNRLRLETIRAPPSRSFVWQENDRVLWVHRDGEGGWLAWHLEDRAVSGFPEAPFIWFDSGLGRPHPIRGFVRTVRAGRRGRIEHHWQNPHDPDLRELHVTPWQQGRAPDLAYGPSSVSPNGRHALVVEKRIDAGSHRFFARSLELASVEVERPRPEH